MQERPKLCRSSYVKCPVVKMQRLSFNVLTQVTSLEFSESTIKVELLYTRIEICTLYVIYLYLYSRRSKLRVNPCLIDAHTLCSRIISDLYCWTVWLLFFQLLHLMIKQKIDLTVLKNSRSCIRTCCQGPCSATAMLMKHFTIILIYFIPSGSPAFIQLCQWRHTVSRLTNSGVYSRDRTPFITHTNCESS